VILPVDAALLDGSPAGDEQRPVHRITWQRAVRDDPTITRTDLLVLLVLSTYANADGTGAYPAEATLAEACGVSTRSVRRAVQVGREKGYVDVTRRGHRRGDGSAVTNAYVLALPSTGHGCPVETAQEDMSDVSRGHGCPVETSQQDMSDVSTGHRGASTGHGWPPSSTSRDRPVEGGEPAPADLVERARALCDDGHQYANRDLRELIAGGYSVDEVRAALDVLERTGRRYNRPRALREALEQQIEAERARRRQREREQETRRRLDEVYEACENALSPAENRKRVRQAKQLLEGLRRGDGGQRDG